jgi:hypothetical protein
MPKQISSSSDISLQRRGPPVRIGTMWISDGISGNAASSRRRLTVAMRSNKLSRSALLDLRWRTLVKAPAARAGGNGVVKIKAGV